MSQSSDIQLSSLQDILKIFRKQALAMPPSSTSIRYLRALESFEASCVRYQVSGSSDNSDSSAIFDKSDLDSSSVVLDSLQLYCTDWLVNLWLTGVPFSTASLYLDIISSLYGSAVKSGLLPATELFSQLKTDLRTLGVRGWKSGIDDEIFDRALRLTKNASHLIADDAIAAQMVIWSLTHNLQPLTDIALLKRSDVQEAGACGEESRVESQGATWDDSQDKDHLLFIINKFSLDKRQRYLFPLRQSQRTPKQLDAYIAKMVNALFRRARLPQATDPYQTVEALWAYAALRSGIPASTLVSHLGHAPLGIPVLKLSAISHKLSENMEGAISEYKC